MNTLRSNDPLNAPLGNVEPRPVEQPPSVKAILEAHPFSKGLTAHQKGLLADCAMSCHFAAGEFIIREGDPANRFYLITKGKVILEWRTGERGLIPIQAIGAGDVLGWSWLFPPFYWHFDAQTAEPTDAVFFYATPLRTECEADHEFGYEILKRISEIAVNRLQWTRRELLKVRKE
jgi:CRP/FNR family transcriptional regulator, cyclic AMP receptor protein